MEEQIRLLAFKWLEEQTGIYGEVLPREILEKGFYYNGERISLVGAQGIWKPKKFDKIPLSITTSPNSPYNDSITKDGYLQYRYMGKDPYHWVNVGLREAMRQQVPLIYFYGLIPGKYLAVWPVYIIDDNPYSLYFTVAVDDLKSIEQSLDNSLAINENTAAIRRRYITSSVRTRLHQKTFREKVLQAYMVQCAFCRLRHAQLLDAAHIIPDNDEMGEPIINNGISLCKIHHAAFDSDIIGVTPDYIIKIREDILHETDGPMLKHGIQELQDHKIILPRNKKFWPDQDRLYVRYKRFRETG